MKIEKSAQILCALGVIGIAYTPTPKPAPSKEVVAEYVKFNTRQRIVWGEKRKEQRRAELMSEINQIRTKIRNIGVSSINSEKLINSIAEKFNHRNKLEITFN